MVEKPIFTTYSLPVSGGSFVAQLGLLSEVYDSQLRLNNGMFRSKSDYEPDLVFSASGGNISAYIGMAGKWTPEGILRVCQDIESEMFIRSWFPKSLNFLPTGLVGIFNGSLYQYGYGGRYLFNSYFTPFSITRTEVWTGTYNVDRRRAQFFCNRNEKDAYIKKDSFKDESNLYGEMPLEYLNGDVNTISDVVTASASIPLLVKAKAVNGENYADGGTMYASPSSLFTDELYKLVNGEFRLRGYYFSSYDMDTPDILKSISGTFGVSEINQLIHTNALLDRAALFKILYQLSGGDSEPIIRKDFPLLKRWGLVEILKIVNECSHCIINLYPAGSPSIKMNKFTIKDIVREIEKSRDDYGAIVWYLE